MMNLFSCQPTKDLPTVHDLDIDKYLGQWYEIARLPNSFEKGLDCVTANYSLKKNGKIEVINKGFLIEDRPNFKIANGTAWRPDNNKEGQLKVTFFWPFAGKYYVITLDEDYQYALVGDPSRKYLWILSRSKTMEPEILNGLMQTAKTNGFDTEQMIMVNQTCN